MSTDAVVIEQPGLTQSERVINTFVAPSKTFEDIHRSRSWWLPFVFSTICIFFFAFSVSHEVDLAEVGTNIAAQQMERFGKTPSQDELAKMHATMGTRMKIQLYSIPAIQLFFSALTALLLIVGFNFILGGNTKFVEMFALTQYAGLPLCIKSILAATLLWFGSTDSFDLKNPIGTNLGYYMPEDASSFLHSFLGSMDVFMIWYLVLLALGASVLANVKTSKGLILVFSVWFVLVLAKSPFF